jgi:hypothetical protein
VERRPGIPFLSSPKDERQWNQPVNEGQWRRPLELGGAVLGVRGKGNGGGKQVQWMKGSISMPFIGWRRRGAAGRGGEKASDGGELQWLRLFRH